MGNKLAKIWELTDWHFSPNSDKTEIISIYRYGQEYSMEVFQIETFAEKIKVLQFSFQKFKEAVLDALYFNKMMNKLDKIVNENHKQNKK